MLNHVRGVPSPCVFPLAPFSELPALCGNLCQGTHAALGHCFNRQPHSQILPDVPPLGGGSELLSFPVITNKSVYSAESSGPLQAAQGRTNESQVSSSNAFSQDGRARFSAHLPPGALKGRCRQESCENRAPSWITPPDHTTDTGPPAFRT